MDLPGRKHASGLIYFLGDLLVSAKVMMMKDGTKAARREDGGGAEEHGCHGLMLYVPIEAGRPERRTRPPEAALYHPRPRPLAMCARAARSDPAAPTRVHVRTTPCACVRCVMRIDRAERRRPYRSISLRRMD